MSYQIVLSPDLQLDTETLVDAWNDDPQCQEAALAVRREVPPAGFPLDPELLQQGLIFLAGVSGAVGAVAVDVVKDLLKEQLTVLLKKTSDRKPKVKVDTVEQPDGSILFVVHDEGT